MESARLSRPWRFRRRTMNFDFSMPVVLLITCTCCLFPQPILAYTHPSSIYATRAPSENDLAAILSQELNRTHSHAHPPAFSSKSTLIPISLHLCFCLRNSVFLLIICALIPYSCLNPLLLRSMCTLTGSFLLAVSYICLVHSCQAMRSL